MKYRPRIYYTDAQKTLMWDRWQKGDSMHTIARLFDRGHSSVQRILSETGGIRPPLRSRSKLSLTLAEREEVSRGLVAGHSIRSIAMSLGRAASTVCREINRNGGRRRYRANQADQAAWDRSHRPKRDVLSVTPPQFNRVLRPQCTEFVVRKSLEVIRRQPGRNHFFQLLAAGPGQAHAAARRVVPRVDQFVHEAQSWRAIAHRRVV